MEDLDGIEFWNRVDDLLVGRKLVDMCSAIGVSYGTVQDQRTHHTIPKLAQIIAMAEFFDISIDQLVLGESRIKKYPKRIEDIADRLMTADYIELAMVERLLTTPGAKIFSPVK